MRRSPAFRACAVGVLATGLLAGCNPEKPPAPPKPVAAEESAGDESVPEITFREVNRDEYDAVLAEHSGKVILVDFWATWCVPCLERFPYLVEFAKKQSARGLVVITLLCDDEPRVAAARDILQKHKVPFVHLRSAHGSGEETFTEFKIKGGALPHYKLYDRQGKLRRLLATDENGPISREDVDRWVLTLLAEKPQAADEAD